MILMNVARQEKLQWLPYYSNRFTIKVAHILFLWYYGFLCRSFRLYCI